MPRRAPATSAVATGAQPIPEADLLAAVTEMARWLGWRAYHTRFSFASGSGYPDLTLVRARPGEPPRILFCELKRDGAEPTDAQRGWLLDLAAVEEYLAATLGERVVSVYVFRPADWISGRIECVLRGSA